MTSLNVFLIGVNVGFWIAYALVVWTDRKGTIG